ncbi:MAG: hypothetical protein COB02_17345 [Candidatus Cloacimonadota bacterium]|nr:MAG: hypothetical protein COB02_17345 [Candidatus Cloacimonadota bacterium]
MKLNILTSLLLCFIFINTSFAQSNKKCQFKNLEKLFVQSKVEDAFSLASETLNCSKSKDLSFRVMMSMQEHLSKYPGDLYESLIMQLKVEKKVKQNIISFLYLLGYMQVDNNMYDASKALLTIDQLIENKVINNTLPILILKADLLEPISPSSSSLIYSTIIKNKNKNSTILSAFATLSLGAIYLKEEKYLKAKKLYSKGILIYKSLFLDSIGFIKPYFHHGLATCFYSLLKPKKAINELNLILKDFPKYPSIDIIPQEINEINK